MKTIEVSIVPGKTYHDIQIDSWCTVFHIAQMFGIVPDKYCLFVQGNEHLKANEFPSEGKRLVILPKGIRGNPCGRVSRDEIIANIARHRSQEI